MAYIEGQKGKGCVFCRTGKKKGQRDNLILFRGKKAYVVMNRYPYINGHLLIVPYRHLNDALTLTSAELFEMSGLIQDSIRALKKAFRPQGFNVGFNVGRAAGAGIDKHLHTHVVPRWVADTNFLAVLGGTRSLPEYLKTTYNRLKERWGKR
jgi:ATP adenylyltransferase